MFTPDSSFWQSARAICLALGVTPSIANIKILAAWSYCEKPHYAGASWQWNNPLNTTQPCCGYTGNANSVGVKIYPSQSAGAAATAQTLKLSYYPTLLRALQTSNASLFFSTTGYQEMSTWGTSMSCVQSDYYALSTPPSQYTAATTPIIVQKVKKTPAVLVPALMLSLGLLGIGTDITWIHDQRTGRWF